MIKTILLVFVIFVVGTMLKATGVANASTGILLVFGVLGVFYFFKEVFKKVFKKDIKTESQNSDKIS